MKYLPFQFVDSFCLRGNLSWFCRLLIFFSKSGFFLFLFFSFFSVISVDCQAVWIKIKPVGPDLGLNCLQRLSADDTSK